MLAIHFIRKRDGKRYDARALPGQSLMEAALAHNIPGILGECGGVCACGTCHIYLDETAAKSVPPMNMHEEDMLSLLDKAQAFSRLACQIILTEEMDGMCVYLPE